MSFLERSHRTRSWYGLGFYLNCQIESVAINQKDEGKWHDQNETLATEPKNAPSTLSTASQPAKFHTSCKKSRCTGNVLLAKSQK